MRHGGQENGPEDEGFEGGWERRQSALEAAYDHFRLELRGNLVSKNTLEYDDYLARPLFDWPELERPEVRSFESLGVEVLRAYRAALSRAAAPRWPAAAATHPA